MKLRRSMLFVPGSNAAMISTSYIYNPDTIMFDLEDSVSKSEKDSARILVSHALSHPVYQDMETVVRVNPMESEYGKKDLQAVVSAGVKIIRLPKTDSKHDILEMQEYIEQIEKDCEIPVGQTKLLAAIESAKGIVNVVEIANSSERLIGIALGAEDYVRDIKTERSPQGSELFYARCSILQAARSVGIMAFDTVYSDVNNEEGFIEEVKQIKQLGFDGKSLVNPRQIDILHKIFAPTPEQIDHAKQVIQAAKEAELRGSGVASLNGKMIDAPIIERANLVLQRAKFS